MKIKIYVFLSICLISISIFVGCEQEYDNPIESPIPDYQVTSVLPSDTVRYISEDSLVTIQISFSSFTNIQSVYCDIFAADNSKLNSSPFALLDNGILSNGDSTANDGIFSNKFPLSTYYPNGTYSIKYYTIDKSDLTKQVALGTFIYNNGQPNVAPVISNDIVNPDSAVVTAPIVILTSVKATDQNGPRDIERVYFVVYRPNGTTNNNQNLMFDDGDIDVHGDQVAGDGIFSLLIQITPQNTKGNYRFEFASRDRNGEISNIINHSVVIQ